MNLGEHLISVPCHFDSSCILLFNCCREPRVYFSAVYFFPWHLQTVMRVKQYRTQQGMCCCAINCRPLCPRGRRPEADCLLPPEKSDNGLTVHFLEDFSVIIKYKWRDLLERKKMRRLFKLPSRLRASSTDRALAVDGVWWGWVLSFAFSGPGLRVLLNFLVQVWVWSWHWVVSLSGRAGDLRVLTCSASFSPAHKHCSSYHLCEIPYSKQEIVTMKHKGSSGRAGGGVSDRPLLFCPLTLNTSLPTGSFSFSTCK